MNKISLITEQLCCGEQLSTQNFLTVCEHLSIKPTLTQSFLAKQTTVSPSLRADVMNLLKTEKHLPSRKLVEKIKTKYLGKEIEMIYMDDPRAIHKGDSGVVHSVDDAGQLKVNWLSGRTLSVCLDGGDLVTIR